MKTAIVARALAAVLAAGGAAAVALASVPSSQTIHAQSFEVEPPAPVVGCPGVQHVPVGDVGSGGDLASEPTDRAYELFAPGNERPAGEGTAVDATVAAQFERIGDGDIAGWSALTCGAPMAEQWLVGGSTSLGASTRLVLTNPSAAPSEATVTLYGPLGQIDATVLVPVAGGGQASRLLEAVATEQSSLVVHVEATGPGVVASLQDSRLEGFQPAGTAWVGASTLAQELVIPGVGFAGRDAAVTVRVMAPDGASVDLSLVSERGVEEWSTGEGLTLEPGVVTDLAVPVSSLGAIEINADAPVVAAARTVVSRAATEGLEGDVAFDATWVPGMPVEDASLTAMTPTQGARVAVYSPYATTVAVTDAAGSVLGTAAVDARTVQWVELDAPAGTVITTTGELAWVLVAASDDGFLASAAPSTVTERPLQATVVTRPYPAGGSSSTP